jgi:hypothetical protein
MSVQKLALELNMPFLETSARTADNVEAAFIKMAEELMRMKYVCGFTMLSHAPRRASSPAAACLYRCALRAMLRAGWRQRTESPTAFP